MMTVAMAMQVGVRVTCLVTMMRMVVMPSVVVTHGASSFWALRVTDPTKPPSAEAAGAAAIVIISTSSKRMVMSYIVRGASPTVPAHIDPDQTGGGRPPSLHLRSACFWCGGV